MKYEIRPCGSIIFQSCHDNLLVLAEIYIYNTIKNELILSKILLNIKIYGEEYNIKIKIKDPILSYYGWVNLFDKFYRQIGMSFIDSNGLRKMIRILDFWDPDDPERKRHKEYFRDNVWEEMMRVFWNPKRKWTEWYLGLC
jgi:hypothetical protein